MKCRALVSFSGVLLSMRKGDIREINDRILLADLSRAGYVEPLEKPAAPPKETPQQPLKAAKKSPKKGK